MEHGSHNGQNRMLFCHEAPVRGKITVHAYTRVHGILCGVVLGMHEDELRCRGWHFGTAADVQAVVEKINRGERLQFTLCESCESWGRSLLMVRIKRTAQQIEREKGHEDDDG